MANAFLLTGLSGAGKTTLAESVLKKLPHNFVFLDGDAMRKGLNSDLGFDAPDREENIRRCAEITRLLLDQGFNVLIAVIAPYESLRRKLREIVGDLCIIHVDCPLEVCIKRDPKQNYKKAFAGYISGYTGIHDRYENPVNPDLHILTSRCGEEEASLCLYDYIKSKIEE